MARKATEVFIRYPGGSLGVLRFSQTGRWHSDGLEIEGHHWAFNGKCIEEGTLIQPLVWQAHPRPVHIIAVPNHAPEQQPPENTLGQSTEIPLNLSGLKEWPLPPVPPPSPPSTSSSSPSSRASSQAVSEVVQCGQQSQGDAPMHSSSSPSNASTRSTTKKPGFFRRIKDHPTRNMQPSATSESPGIEEQSSQQPESSLLPTQGFFKKGVRNRETLAQRVEMPELLDNEDSEESIRFD